MMEVVYTCVFFTAVKVSDASASVSASVSASTPATNSTSA